MSCTTGQTVLGAGVRWDARRGELLRVDLLTGSVYRDRVSDDGSLVPVRVYSLPGTVGAIAPIQGDDGWLLAAGRSFVHVSEDGSTRTLADVAWPGTRMNDGACDPQGRFWAGTIADDHHAGGGALYRLRSAWAHRVHARRSHDLQRTRVEPRRRHDVPGGQWPARRPRVRVRRRHGTISNGRVLVTVAEELGAPDGMTVDAAGDLWVAIYGAGQVHRYSPDGELRQVVAVPVEQTTCCGFAGPGLSRLYVTTATENWSDNRRRAEPAAGLVYWSETDTSGLPAAPFSPDIDWWKAVTT